jgi:hypothetical protein
MRDRRWLLWDLRSDDQDVRRRAAAELRHERDAGAEVAELLLEDPGGAVAGDILDLLGELADPAADEVLRWFADGDDRFELVWRARHALDASAGLVAPGRSDPVTRLGGTHGARYLVEAMTWRAPTHWSTPGPALDGWTVTMSPTFHPELLLTLTAAEASVRCSRRSLSGPFGGGDGWNPSVSRIVVATDPAVIGRLHDRAVTGFAEETGDRSWRDGLVLGGLRYEGGEARELPLRQLTGGPLLDLVATARTLALAAATDASDTDALRDLGAYLRA